MTDTTKEKDAWDSLSARKSTLRKIDALCEHKKSTVGGSWPRTVMIEHLVNKAVSENPEIKEAA
jgi:hypothetical protein